MAQTINVDTSKLDTVIQVYTATEDGNKSMITELPYNVLK